MSFFTALYLGFASSFAWYYIVMIEKGRDWVWERLKKNWRLSVEAGLLAAVVLGDGVLLGGTMAVMNGWDNRAARTVKEVMASEELVVALTFDDGPHPEYTARLLDGLKARDVKVTFFLMGQNISGNEELVKRMQEEGHLIGNHSYCHVPLTKAGEQAVCQAVEETEQIITEITGSRPQYLRPPYGDWNDALENCTELRPVFWSVDSLDWKLQNTGRIVRRVLDRTETGDVILMHDIFPTSVEAALEIVDALKEKGYQFVTVDELLID